MKANDIRPGIAVTIDNQLWIVTQREHVKPGKGPAYIQVKIKSIATGSVQEKRLRSTEEVAAAILDKRTMQYLYKDSTGYVFMDDESFEQMVIPEDLLGDAMLYVKENTDIQVQLHEGRPVTIDLPSAVDLLVTDTTPQVKGATATNQLKEAILETGLKTRVPPFIEIGELIRVSTEDASYMGRAS